MAWLIPCHMYWLQLKWGYCSCSSCLEDTKSIMRLSVQTTHTLSPLWACVLIGGKSSRMGQPKHLIKHPSGQTWLEEAVEQLKPYVENVVIAGSGEVPDNLSYIKRVDDYPDVVGPLAGIMGAASIYPEVSWLLIACDMPLISDKALQWLTDKRRVECAAVIPKQQGGKGFVEPLFACYESQCEPLFQEIIASGSLKISDICKFEGVCTEIVPTELEQSWTNANTPEDIKKIF